MIDGKTFVYFIRCNDYVKIGRSSNPKERLKSLQAYNPYKLELLFYTDKYTEKELHEKFEEARINGEWFELSSNIIQKFLTKEKRGFLRKKLKIDIWKDGKKLDFMPTSYAIDRVELSFKQKWIDLIDSGYIFEYFQSEDLEQKNLLKMFTVEDKMKESLAPYRLDFNEVDTINIGFDKKTIPLIEERNKEMLFICPFCGFDYVHIEKVEVSKEGQHSCSTKFKCSCESGHYYWLKFETNKGQTYIELS